MKEWKKRKKEGKREGMEGGREENSSYLLKSGASTQFWSSTWEVGTQVLNYHLLPPRVYVSRKLEWRANA